MARGPAPRGHSDRQDFRLLLPEHQVFEVYYDRISNVWVLDVIQD